MVPVGAVIAALVLNASAAHGQAVAADLPASSDEPQVSVPSSSNEPQASVPKPKPEPELKPVGPDSLRQVVDPESPPAGAKPQAPSLSEPEMTYAPRWDLVVGGLLIMGPGLALGSFALAVSDMCIPDGCRLGTGDLVALGGIEAVGATLLIVGIVGHDVPAPPTPQGQNLTFLPLVTPKTEGLSMSMRW
jgi:hypothetical protein